MNIYVGNLSYDATEADLRAVFEGFGPVESVQIIRDGASRKSKGFGFVEMSDSRAAQKAIFELDKRTAFSGRKLRVNRARKPPQRNRGTYRDGKRFDGVDGGLASSSRSQRIEPKSSEESPRTDALETQRTQR